MSSEQTSAPDAKGRGFLKDFIFSNILRCSQVPWQPFALVTGSVRL
jgi:hypothetical protein